MNAPELTPASADEAVVWQGQPRRRVVLRGLAIGLALAAVVLTAAVFVWRTDVAGPTVIGALLVVAILGLTTPTAATYLWHKHTHYLLTDSALYHRTGVLWITVTELGLDKVQNTAYSQGVFGTLFDHGSVTVDTAGSDEPELRLRSLNDPAEVHRRIATQAGEARGRDEIPGTVDQWAAILSEVQHLRAVIGAE